MMTDTMNRERKLFFKRAAESPKIGPVPWNPKGGREVYVHSQLSEPYGEQDGEGLEDVLSEENIRVARECRQVDQTIDPNSPDSINAGLREIGRILVGTITVVRSKSDIDTTDLIEVQPLK